MLDSAEIDLRLEEFHDALSRGERLDLAAGECDDRLLVELIHAELEYRWKHGDAARVEEYVTRYPRLGEDANAVVELVLAERTFEARRGTVPSAEEYLRRFPSLAALLAVRLVETEPTERVAARPEAGAFPKVPGYKVLEKVGRGGMGVVFKARQDALKRVVALKVIASVFADPEALQRFSREAETLALLDHPHVVRIHDYGEVEARPYLVMEFVDGSDLDKRLREGPLPARAAAVLTEAVARAIHEAHQCGIVHRDLKPSNVLLAKKTNLPPSPLAKVDEQASGLPYEPKVTDFGLAKWGGSEEMTQTGALMGTPSYMAPEQADGDTKGVGPATDVYGIGAILYESLTGRPPFKAATALQTLEQVRTQDAAPPRQLNASVPRDLETICLKCLHKEQRRRYASAVDLANDLRRFLDGKPILARRVRSLERLGKWARRQPAIAALSATLLLGGLTAFVLLTLLLQEANHARRQRVLAQLDGLRNAAPGAVPGILADLEANRADVLPRLRELHASEDEPARGMRLALALLPVEPESVREDVLAWMLKVEEPAEVLLFREALKPHADEVTAPLWLKADNGTRSGERFRALVALAAFDPTNPRWAKVAPGLVDELLAANPIHFGHWVKALHPLREALVPPLCEAFRRETPAGQKQIAAQVLVEYAADQPVVLLKLSLDADAKQFAALRPALERHREPALRRMRQELASRPDFWKDGRIHAAMKPPAPESQREVEQAGGLFSDSFALCQTLPLARLQAVTEGLRPAGYRPVRVRPWARSVAPMASHEKACEGEGVLVAVVWSRDGRDWQLRTGLTADAVDVPPTGLLPTDVAGYRTTEGERYCVLWRKGDAGHQAAAYAGMPEAAHKAEAEKRKQAGYTPYTLQGLRGPDGVIRYSGVWWKGTGKPPDGELVRGDDENSYADRTRAGELLLLDVDVGPAGSLDPSRDSWQVELADAALEAQLRPNTLNAVYRRGVALYHLGRFTEALVDLDTFIEKGRPVKAYRYRALVRARAGRAAAARRDLAAFAERGARNEDVVLAAALADVYIGEGDWPTRLEGLVRDQPQDATLLVEAARVYAQAAERFAVRQLSWAVGVVGVPSMPAALSPPPGER